VRIGGKWGRNPLVGTLFATFLPEEQVVPFISAVLDWYKEKADGKGRVRLGDTIITEGAAALVEHLKKSFPDSVFDGAIPPQVVVTQVGTQR